MRTLALVLAALAVAGCAAAATTAATQPGPALAAPDGAKTIVVPANTSVKVNLGGRAGELSLQFDAEDVGYTLHAVRSGAWQRISPKQLVRSNPATALADTLSPALEGEFHYYADALGAQALILTNAGTVQAEVRAWWTLAK